MDENQKIGIFIRSRFLTVRMNSSFCTGKFEMIGKLPDPLQAAQTFDLSSFAVSVDDRGN
jgi:hypothetical protein